MEELHRNTFLRSALVKDPFCFGVIGPEDVLRIESQFPDLFHSKLQIETGRMKEILPSPYKPPQPKVPVTLVERHCRPLSPPPPQEVMSTSRKNYEMPIKCTKPRCQPDWKPLRTPIKKKVKSSFFNETALTPKTEITLPFDDSMQISQSIISYEEPRVPNFPKKENILEKEKNKMKMRNFGFISPVRKKLGGTGRVPVQNKRQSDGIRNESEKAKIIKKLQEKLVIDPFIKNQESTYGPPMNLLDTVIEILQKQEKSSLEKLALEIFRGDKFSMPRELIQPQKTLKIQPMLQNRAIRSPTPAKNVKVKNCKYNFKNKEPSPPSTRIDGNLKQLEWRKSSSSFATTPEDSNEILEEIILPYKILTKENKPKLFQHQIIDKRSSKCSQTDQMSIQPKDDLKEMIREVLGGEMISLEKIAQQLIQAEIEKQKMRKEESKSEIGIQKDNSSKHSKENSGTIHFEKTKAKLSSEENDSHDLLATPQLTPKEQIRKKGSQVNSSNGIENKLPTTPQITPEKLQKDKDEVTDCSEISEFVLSLSNQNGLKGAKVENPNLDITVEGIQEIKTPIFTSPLSENEKSLASMGKTEISDISLTNDLGGISIGTEKTNYEKSKSKVSFAKTLSQREKSEGNAKNVKSSREDSYTLDFENPLSEKSENIGSEYALSEGEYIGEIGDGYRSPGEVSYSHISPGQVVEGQRFFARVVTRAHEDDSTDNGLSLGEVL